MTPEQTRETMQLRVDDVLIHLTRMGLKGNELIATAISFAKDIFRDELHLTSQGRRDEEIILELVRSALDKLPFGTERSIDIPELNATNGLSRMEVEEIKNFRLDRLTKISMNSELPVPLDPLAAKTILHIVPSTAFELLNSFDVQLLTDNANSHLMKPLIHWQDTQHDSPVYTVDGLLSARRWPGANPPPASYVQVFRNGIVEAVDVTLLNYSRNHQHLIHGVVYEQRLIEAVKRYSELQQLLGVKPPLLAMVSFLGVKGYQIAHPKAFYYEGASEKIDRFNLVLPEVIIEQFDDNITKIMKPIFDIVWNAVGKKGSGNYDVSGNSTLSTE